MGHHVAASPFGLPYFSFKKYGFTFRTAAPFQITNASLVCNLVFLYLKSPASLFLLFSLQTLRWFAMKSLNKLQADFGLQFIIICFPELFADHSVNVVDRAEVIKIHLASLAFVT